MGFGKNLSLFVSSARIWLLRGSREITPLLIIFLLATSSTLEARPICSSIAPMDLEQWMPIEGMFRDDVFELEAPEAGTLFFAWRNPEGLTPPLVVSWLADACDSPEEALETGARGIVFLPRAGTYLLRFAADPESLGSSFPTEARARFRPSRIPRFTSALDTDPWPPAAPSGLEEWEIDILSLGEEPEEEDAWSQMAGPPQGDLEEWEIDILSQLPRDPRSVLLGLAEDPGAHLESHRLLVGRAGRLEIVLGEGEALGLLRLTPGHPARRVELAAPQSRGFGVPGRSASSVHVPVVPGLYALQHVSALGSQSLDRSRIRIYELYP